MSKMSEGWGFEAKINLCSQQRRVRPTVCRSNELKRGETLQGQRSVSVAIILNKILEKIQEKKVVVASRSPTLRNWTS